MQLLLDKFFDGMFVLRLSLFQKVKILFLQVLHMPVDDFICQRFGKFLKQKERLLLLGQIVLENQQHVLG